jgi:hypothetical protein
VAALLGISPGTLQKRMYSKSHGITQEMMLALRWVYEHPESTESLAAVHAIPEPPELPTSTVQQIATILRHSSRPLNKEELQHQLKHAFHNMTGLHVISNRLSAMLNDPVPMIMRSGHGMYMASEFNK